MGAGDPRGPIVRSEMDAIAQQLAKTGVVDLLDGGPKAKPKPSLANGVPTIYTSQVPTELVVFKGQPDFVPIVGTQLLWASNTTSDVLIDTANNNYYVLLSGRWFRSAQLTGPWSFVASNALPEGFAKIPPASLAGAVLPSVAGTPQAQEAVIANSVPQTATVPRTNGPKFTPSFDGPPQYDPIPGTPLTYVVNASVPVIQVTPSSYYAVSAGVWFTAGALTGPWMVAASVPAVIYTIPPSSPVHYVTYVRIYEATPQVVYVGYTPGYLGTVIEPSGTVVYGTGYAYSPWVGAVWYPPPYTYGVAAVPVYNPYVGFTFGFALGLATAAWTEPYWGGAYYYPAYWGGYPCCASASANVYGQWGNTVYSGTRSWYAGGGVAGTTASGTYYNQRTGTSGSYTAGRQYNAYTGNATRGYDRTVNGAAGGSGNVARASNYNVYSGQRSTGSAVSGTTAGGSTYDRAGATTAGPRAMRTSAAVRPTTPRPARPTTGRRRRSATTTTPTSTATSTRTPATAGSSTRRAAGAARPATRRGPTRNRRRGAPATSKFGGFSEASPFDRKWRSAASAVAVTASAVAASAAADLAVLTASVAVASVAAAGAADSVAGRFRWRWLWWRRIPRRSTLGVRPFLRRRRTVTRGVIDRLVRRAPEEIDPRVERDQFGTILRRPARAIADDLAADIPKCKTISGARA